MQLYTPQGSHKACSTRSPRSHRASAVVPPAAVSRPTTSVVQAPPTARTKEDLQDPAHIFSKGQATVEVKDYPEPTSLSQYMLLPVEQYFVLNPQSIRHLSGKRFLLQVPRIQIFNVWIEPEVEISVTTQEGGPGEPAKVVLHAENCRIRGSDLIQSWRIDQRFCMRFVTELTWASAAQQPQQQQQEEHQQQQQQLLAHSSSLDVSTDSTGSSSNGTYHSSHPEQNGNSNDAHSSGAPNRVGLKRRLSNLGARLTGRRVQGSEPGTLQPVGQGRIWGQATLDVWCEVIPPFNLMPRDALQASCNAVLYGLVQSLLPLFVRQLGADYQRWATQPAYRAERAARSKPLEQEVEQEVEVPAA